MAESDVCVVGGGPAGLMLSLLLVRQGLRVTVLEKHGDFLRDFRGDTVHLSTMDLIDELGLGEQFDALPHQRLNGLRATFADGTFQVTDFGRLRRERNYLMMMPQWEFLTFLAEQAAAYDGFTLLRSTEVLDVIREDGVVRGVVGRGPDGPVEVRALLTVAADGRESVVRERLGLARREYGAPMDVLWFRVSRRPDDPAGLDTHVGAGQVAVGIDRGSYWQLAYLVPKRGVDAARAAGLAAFRDDVARLVPHLRDRVGEIATWEDVKALTVRVDRLRRWYAPGVLLIGDAAHAMSPVGGVGINLAIQDAAAAARLLAGPVKAGRVSERDLARVQRRRMAPTLLTQAAQRIVQAVVVRTVLAADRPPRAPLPVKALRALPALQGVTARAVGLGLLREHVPPVQR